MSNDKRRLAVIPARGGSKGIKNKNLQLICGRPLIAWGIDYTCKASCVDELVVSTDDPAIAEVARRSDTDVVMRPGAYCRDDSPSELALLHALEQFEAQRQVEVEWLIFVQCTAPLTLPEDIDGLMADILDAEADCGLLAAPFHGFIWEKAQHGSWRGVNHDLRVRPMRQELTSQFIEAGAVNIMRAKRFKRERHRFFGRVIVRAIPQERCLDINTMEDLAWADMVLRQRRQSN